LQGLREKAGRDAPIYKKGGFLFVREASLRGQREKTGRDAASGEMYDVET